ncbi:hypothetical protein ACS0TY_006392 [Phlomoides rotata]
MLLWIMMLSAVAAQQQPPFLTSPLTVTAHPQPSRPPPSASPFSAKPTASPPSSPSPPATPPPSSPHPRQILKLAGREMKVTVVTRSGRELIKGGLELSDSATVADLQDVIHKRSMLPHGLSF